MRVLNFIYQPRSGDRVVAENPTTTLAVVKWANGCRHLVGQHVVLSYYAATPGEHWRYDASLAAAQIVAATGGVAWDERGTIYLAVPPERAVAADRMMSFIGQIPAGEAKENQKALYLAGLLRIVGAGRGLEFQPLAEHEVPASAEVLVVTGPERVARTKRDPESGEETPVEKTVVTFRLGRLATTAVERGDCTPTDFGGEIEVSAPWWEPEVLGGVRAPAEASA